MKKIKLIILLLLLLFSCAILKVITDVGPVIGSTESNVYHLPHCHYVQNILPGNLIQFANEDSAKAHSYRPCIICFKR